MLIPYSSAQRIPFEAACRFEQVVGTKLRNALTIYGPNDPAHRFWLARSGDEPVGALYLNQGVLIMSASDDLDPSDVESLARQGGIHEIDCGLSLCETLHARLGGRVESSYYMVYRGGPIEERFEDIETATLPAVFEVLQQSHEYYRSHLSYGPWSADLESRIMHGCTEICQLICDGKVVGTGSILSQDESCGAIAAVAVIPAYRHRGLGTRITRYLVSRIQRMGKTPRLVAGYDEVAELYRRIGFETCGRWGELYL